MLVVFTVLAGWFPQITCRRHEVFTRRLFTGEFQVHSITDLVQNLYTAGKFLEMMVVQQQGIVVV